MKGASGRRYIYDSIYVHTFALCHFTHREKSLLRQRGGICFNDIKDFSVTPFLRNDTPFYRLDPDSAH